MPVFDAGAVVGHAKLDLTGWTRNVKQSIADTANINKGLAGTAAQCAATSVAIVGVSSALQSIKAVAGAQLGAFLARMAGIGQAAAVSLTEVEKLKAAAVFKLESVALAEKQAAALAASSAAAAQQMGTLKTAALGLTAGVGGTVLAVGGLAAAVFSIASAYAAALRQSIAFEASFVGVRKTVDATEDEFTALEKSMREMSTRIPVSVHQLNAIAEAAGQLGVEAENIDEFTKAMAGVGVATNMTADEAATSFAQWANITGLAEDKIDNLASTVVRLGNETASTERQIVEMGNRIAGAASTVGLTDAEVVGLAATLASLGIEAEAAGSAASNILYDLALAVDTSSEKLPVFAALAGQTATEFAKHFRAKPMDALQDVIQGLDTLQKSGQGFTQTLKALGQTDIRVMRAIAGLAGDASKLRDNVASANVEISGTAALTREMARAFATTDAKLQIFHNLMEEIARLFGDQIKPAFDGALVSLGWLMEKVDRFLEKRPALVKSLAYSVMPDWLETAAHAFEYLNLQINEQKRLLGELGDMQRKGVVFGPDNMLYERQPPPVFAATAQDAARLQARLAELSVTGDRAKESLFKIGDTAQETRERLKGLLGTTADLSDETLKLIRAAGSKMTVGDLDALVRSAKMGGDEVVNLQKRLQDLEVAFRLGALSGDEVYAEMRRTWEDTGSRIGMTIDEIIPKLSDLSTEFRGLFGVAARDEAIENLGKDLAESGDRLADVMGKAEDARIEKANQYYNGLIKVAGALDEIIDASVALQEEGLWSPETVRALAESAVEQFQQYPVILDQIIAKTGEWNGELQRAMAAARDADLAKALSLGGNELVEGLREGEFQDMLARVQEVQRLVQDVNPEGQLLQWVGMIGEYEARLGELPAATLQAIALELWGQLGDAIEDKGVRAVEDFLDRVRAIDPEMAAALEGASKAMDQASKDWAKSSSDLTGWAGLADNIGKIGQALGQLGPKFQKVAQGAKVAQDAIKLAMSPDPVSRMLNALHLAADAMGLFGDETEEVKTGLDRVLEEIGNSVEGWADQMADAIVEFARTGKLEFKELVDSILSDMLRLTIKYGILQPLFGAFGMEFAKGAAFDKGNIVPFARGGVVTKPAVFPLAGGAGVMGEAGPEAVIPLKRLRDGRLGVSAEGGPAAGGTVVVNFIDQRAGGEPLQVEQRESVAPDGSRQIDLIITNAVERGIRSGRFDKVMDGTYGLARRGRR